MQQIGDYDVVIVGGGLAGLTAALFAARYGHSTLVLEPRVPGGPLVSVEKVEDFPGFPEGIPGYDLGPLVQEQAANQGAEFGMAEVRGLEMQEPYWLVQTDVGPYRARAVIIATGSRPRELGIPGEERLRGRGVSHCATCDGPLFRGQVVGVVGGGDSALQEALTLASFASRVILFCRGGMLTGQHSFRERVGSHPRLDVRYRLAVEEIVGEQTVTGVRVRDTATGEEGQVEMVSLFVYAGSEANSAFLQGRLPLDEDGHIPTDIWMQTELAGVFAAGDVRQHAAGQAITAAGDGATAAVAAHRYLHSRSWA